MTSVPEIARRFIDGVWQTGVADDGGGGSQTGALAFADFIFNEPAAEHADLKATFDVPAGATVLDMWMYSIAAPWADATAALDVIADPLGIATYYVHAVDLSINGNTLYQPYEPLAGPDVGGFDSLRTSSVAYAGISPFSGNLAGVLYPDGVTISLAVSGIATGGGGAQLLVRFVYATLPTTVVAS